MKATYLFAAALGVLASASMASAAVQSGIYKGMKWEAQSRIIGGTPTTDAFNTGGGDPIYLPTGEKNGTVALIMTYANDDRFICSGSLANDRFSIVTAGHCVSSGAVKDPDLVKTTAYFWDGTDTRTALNPGVVAIDVSQYFVNPLYSGEVIDQNDIAVLRLGSVAPGSATGYDMSYVGDLTGSEFNVAGYGRRSTVGGAVGYAGAADGRTGWLREGDNIYDWAWGDAAWDGYWDGAFGTADATYSFISDFDNGLAANDTACRIADAVRAEPGGVPSLPAGFGCNTGVGAREVGIAGGDSGGPGFVDGKLASVNSYGLTFGTAYGDYLSGLQSSWGEFSGYVPIYIHEDFLEASFVPEPASWAMMIGGFAMIGGAMRRQRNTVLA